MWFRGTSIGDGIWTYLTRIVFDKKLPEFFDNQDLLLNEERHYPTSWGNVGYWKGTSSFPEAGENLAKELGYFANLATRDVILDVGFGMGQQFYIWLGYFHVNHCHGINISKAQTDYCRKHVLPVFKSKLDIFHGTIETVNLPNEMFTKVLVLDAIYHFSDKSKFFGMVFDYLQKGGVLAFTDMAIRTDKKLPFFVKHLLRLGGIPTVNQNTIDELKRSLSQQGYENIEVIDISPFIFDGFHQFLREFGHGQKSRLRPYLLLRYWMAAIFTKHLASKYIHYVMVKAKKS